MSEEIKLSPCPFCGGEGSLCADNIDKKYVVLCDDCTAEVGIFKTRVDAIAAWNRRPKPSNGTRTATLNDEEWDTICEVLEWADNERSVTRYDPMVIRSKLIKQWANEEVKDD